MWLSFDMWAKLDLRSTNSFQLVLFYIRSYRNVFCVWDVQMSNSLWKEAHLNGNILKVICKINLIQSSSSLEHFIKKNALAIEYNGIQLFKWSIDWISMLCLWTLLILISHQLSIQALRLYFNLALKTRNEAMQKARGILI